MVSIGDSLRISVAIINKLCQQIDEWEIDSCVCSHVDGEEESIVSHRMSILEGLTGDCQMDENGLSKGSGFRIHFCMK